MSHAPRPRLDALDLLRGLTVALMILVNNPGNWNRVYPPLTHAAWNGVTLADLVFPAFVVIMGIAVALVLAPQGEGERRHRLEGVILRRAALLVLLGLLLNAASAWPHVRDLRLPGVLQRLGITYLATALIVVRTPPRWHVPLAGALYAGHWALLSAGGPLAPGANLGAQVDRALFGTHLLTAAGDPEGVLGTVPCIATALLGASAGHWLKRQLAAGRRRAHMAGMLSAAGLAAAATGLAWSAWLPLNKALWTGSFALVATGATWLALAACLVAERTPLRSALAPLQWLGLNPLAIYFLSELTATVLQRPWGMPLSPKDALFWNVIVPVAGDHGEPGSSLLYAGGYLLLWAAVAGLMRWRGVRLRV